jgi:hypothetical protein
MRNRRLAIGLLIIGSAACCPPALARNDPEPPLVRQPANFSGAIGSFKVAMQAEPIVLQAEDSLLLTIRVSGRGNLNDIRRPDLRKARHFSRDFEISDAGEKDVKDHQSRQFSYRLRPRSPAVREIPPFPFVFFKAGMIPPENGYQTTWAPAIAIHVLPRPETPDTQIEENITAGLPPSIRSLITGPGVLRDQSPPNQTAWLWFMLVPPAVCVAWHFMFASATLRGRHGRWRRNARQALRELVPGELLPERIEFIVTDFLRSVIGLQPRVIGPTDLRKCLSQNEFSGELIALGTQVFEACAAVRFAPAATISSVDLRQTARAFIAKLEEEACSRLPD